MHRRVLAPRRLRGRIAVAFVLVAGSLSGGLALGSFLLVRQTRLDDSLDRAETQARINLNLAGGLRPQADLRQFVDSYGAERELVLLVSGDRRFPSVPGFDPSIPADLEGLVSEGRLAFERLTIEGQPYLVVGGRPAGSEIQLYSFFGERRLRDDLSRLGAVLIGGWTVVVAVAALVGWLVAGRTLAPVAEASRAARSMAEGLLDTRLPVGTADEFGAWAASFNEMAEALEGKIAALSEARARERRFTSDVAHELRTPLTALVAQAAVLEEHLERVPPEARRPVEALIADVARLRRLVEDLVEISRLDAGRESLLTERVDLGLLVAATIRARGWEGRVALRSEDVFVESDRRRLERVVSNLVENAVEHGRRDIEVVVGSDGDGAYVTVSDEGPGIASDHLPHVFDRFYKADPARSGRGSGLGLGIALENARLVGGDIRVTSEPGVGSRFTLRLPATEPLHGGDGPVSSGEDDGGATDPGRGNGS